MYLLKVVHRSISLNLPVINKKNKNNAKINTCQIQQTTKTLKFVPANNSSLNHWLGQIPEKAAKLAQFRLFRAEDMSLALDT